MDKWTQYISRHSAFSARNYWNFISFSLTRPAGEVGGVWAVGSRLQDWRAVELSGVNRCSALHSKHSKMTTTSASLDPDFCKPKPQLTLAQASERNGIFYILLKPSSLPNTISPRFSIIVLRLHQKFRPVSNTLPPTMRQTIFQRFRQHVRQSTHEVVRRKTVFSKKVVTSAVPHGPSMRWSSSRSGRSQRNGSRVSKNCIRYRWSTRAKKSPMREVPQVKNSGKFECMEDPYRLI